MNTFETVCQIVGVLLLVAAITCILVVACNKPVRWLSIILLVLVFTVSSCNGHGNHTKSWKGTIVNSPHDTGTYAVYRAINLETKLPEVTYIDTNWNVFQATDTVVVDPKGFKTQMLMRDENRQSASIYHKVQLGICIGIITLVDDTIILKSVHYRGAEKLGTAD